MKRKKREEKTHYVRQKKNKIAFLWKKKGFKIKAPLRC